MENYHAIILFFVYYSTIHAWTKENRMNQVYHVILNILKFLNHCT